MKFYIAAVVTVALIHQVITGRKIMDEFDEILKRIDVATTALGQRVATLFNSVKAVTDEQRAEADRIVANLTGIAADPANPVPGDEEPESPVAEPTGL